MAFDQPSEAEFDIASDLLNEFRDGGRASPTRERIHNPDNYDQEEEETMIRPASAENSAIIGAMQAALDAPDDASLSITVRNEANVLDTTTRDGQEGIIQLFQSPQVSQGQTFIDALQRIPATLGKLSRGYAIKNLITALKFVHILPAEFKGTQSRMNASQKAAFDAGVIAACSNVQHLTLITAAVLRPFLSERETTRGGMDAGIRNSDCNDVLRMLLVGHLLLEPSASEIWTALYTGPGEANTPAALDLVDTQKTHCCARLNEIAMSIRTNVDLSKFDANLIGDDAHADCMLFDLSTVTFKHANDIASFATRIRNDLDELLSRLDASGGHLPIGMERRIVCWDRFVGPPFRNKNTSLFYLFVLLEDEEIRWKSRRLAPGYGSVESSMPANSPSGRGPGSSSLSQRNADYMIGGFMKALDNRPKPSSASLSPPNRDTAPMVADSKKRMYESKSKVHEETQLSIQSSRTEQAMLHPAFKSMPEADQKTVQENWAKILLKSSEPK